MTRPVRVDFIAKDQASGAMDKIARKADGLGSKFASVGKGIGIAMGGAAIGGVVAFGAALVQGVKDAASYQVVLNKTAAVIKSTGNVAHISVGGVKNLAAKLETLSGVDEELIINSQNVLATFTKVRNETGKGNKIFDLATKAALNMSSALGTDLQGATIQIGKALNNPIKGITALSRAGVSFTDKQKEMIKKLVESGHTLDAQKIILRELNTEFGGAAKAAGTGFTGAVARAKDAVSDMFRGIGQKLLPGLTNLANWITEKGVPAFSKFTEKARDAFNNLKLKLPKVDWSKLGDGIGKAASSWGGKILSGLKTALDKGDFGPLGRSLGEALRKSLVFIAGAIAKWAKDTDWVEVGKKVGKTALPFLIGFAVTLFEPLLSGEFWKKHWLDVLFAIATVIPAGKLLTFLKPIISKIPLLRAFIPLFDKLGKLADFLWKPIRAAVMWVGRRFAGIFRRLFPHAAKGLEGLFEDIFVRVGVWALELRAKAVALAKKFGQGINEGIEKAGVWVLRKIGRLIMLMLRPWIGAGRWLIGHGMRLIRGLMSGISRVASSLGGWLRRVIWRPISDVMSSVRRSFSNTVSRIGEVWGRLRDKTRKPVQFMVNTVYNNGIRALWNKVNNIWGGKDLPRLRFAGGGVLPGYQPGRDTVPAMLSPGEGILRPEVVKQLGPDRIFAWNKAAKDKKRIALFADGGIVGLLKSAGGSMLNLFSSPVKWLRRILSGPLAQLDRIRDSAWGRAVARIPGKIIDRMVAKGKSLIGLGGTPYLGRDPGGSVNAILRVARLFQSNAQVSSGYRPGDPGYHGRGLAADLIGGGAAGMNRIARGFYAISGRLLELIHSPSWFVKNGRKVGADFYRSVYGQHFNHVHVAARQDALTGAFPRNIPAGLYDKGGVLPAGVSMAVNRTGGGERVLTDAQWRSLAGPLLVTGNDTEAARFVMSMLKKGVVKIVGPRGTVQLAVMGR